MSQRRTKITTSNRLRRRMRPSFTLATSDKFTSESVKQRTHEASYKPTSNERIFHTSKETSNEDTVEPKDESIPQANPDDDREEISQDHAAGEPEKPDAALKMIEEAEFIAIKLAKQSAYKKYNVPHPKPISTESVPFRHFSRIHYIGIAGLRHRLVRLAAAI